MTDGKRQRGFEKGLALVAVLWTVILMTVLVVLSARGTLLDTRVSLIEIERQRCQWAARAGVETAIALLLEDDRTSDSLFDLWAQHPQLSYLELDGVTVEVQVVDASSKLSLNTATAEQMIWLPDMTEDVTASIIDWRDTDDDIRPGGAESGYYLSLPIPYRARNTGFVTVRELLRVKGVTEELFEGVQDSVFTQENEGWKHYFTVQSVESNNDALGQAKVQINRAGQQELQNLSLPAEQARWITENRPFSRWEELLRGSSQQSGTQQPGQTGGQTPAAGGAQQTQTAAEGQPLTMDHLLSIIDSATLTRGTFNYGKVNVNTAGVIVLTALLEGRRELAEQIVQARMGFAEGFTGLKSLRDVPGMTDELLLSLLDTVSVRSSIFEIHAVAASQATNLRYRMEVLVNRDASDGQVLYWHEGISK